METVAALTSDKDDSFVITIFAERPRLFSSTVLYSTGVHHHQGATLAILSLLDPLDIFSVELIP